MVTLLGRALRRVPLVMQVAFSTRLFLCIACLVLVRCFVQETLMELDLLPFENTEAYDA